jgi:Lysophospholipase L1 and related esterases
MINSIKITFFVFALVIFGQAHLSRADTPLNIVMLGDSLTAGYGLDPQDALPEQITRALRSDAGINVRIINQGLSGDTSAGGLLRLQTALDLQPDGLILALGSNDALRGLPVAITYENLDQIMSTAAQLDIPVLLVGAKAPNNWGPSYQQEFDNMYVQLSQQHDATLYPFILEGVALNDKFNQPDMMHPNKQGVQVIVKKLAPVVRDFIEKHLKNTFKEQNE